LPPSVDTTIYKPPALPEAALVRKSVAGATDRGSLASDIAFVFDGCPQVSPRRSSAGDPFSRSRRPQPAAAT
jgi:hypothetical protein